MHFSRRLLVWGPSVALVLVGGACNADGEQGPGGSTGGSTGSTGGSVTTGGTSDGGTTAGSGELSSGATNDATVTGGSGTDDGSTAGASSEDTGGTLGSSSGTSEGGETESETGGPQVPDCSVMEPCTGATVWSRAVGGPMIQWGSAVTTFDDRVFAVGFATDMVVTGDIPDLEVSGNDLVVFEVEATTGTVLWAQVIAGECGATARIAAAADQVLVLGSCAGEVDVAGEAVGTFASGAFVVGRFTLDGATTGADAFGATVGSVGASWITAHESGAFALVGYFSGAIDFGLGQLQAAGSVQDMVAVVFEADGSPRWSRRFGDGAPQRGLSGEFAPDGDLVVFGNNEGVIDFGGNPLDGDGLAAARLDADTGQPVWSTLYPGTGVGYVVASDSTADGIVIATRGGSLTPATVLDFGDGDLQGHSLVANLGYDGALQWERSFESVSSVAGLGFVYGVAIDGAGSVLLAGHGVSTIDLGLGDHTPAGRDGFVLKLDSSGTPSEWVRWVTDWDQQAVDQRLEGVAVDSAGTAYVIGRFAGHVNLGDQELVADGQDMLLAALEP